MQGYLFSLLNFNIMKRIFLFLAFLLSFSQFSFSQNIDETTIFIKEKILMLDIEEVNVKVEKFINSNKLIPESYFKSKDVIDFTVFLT